MKDRQKIAKSPTLNKRQLLFVKEYLIDLNATQAAIRAGYSSSAASEIGHENLRKPQIVQMIQVEMDKRSQKVEITAEKVLSIIFDTIQRCQQARPVLDKFGKNIMVETPNGDLAPVYKFDAQAVLKGAELLGKHLKIFTDKVEVSGNLKSMSDEELKNQVKVLEIELKGKGVI